MSDDVELKIDEEPEEGEEQEKSAVKPWKFWTVFAIMFFAFIMILVRLFFVQVYEVDKFKAQAKRQHEARIPLNFERGNIYDRHHRLIASTINCLSIAADPRIIKQKYKLAKVLERATGKSYRYYLKKINRSKKAFVWLERGLLPDRTSELEKLNIKGTIKIHEAKRNFLYGQVGSQIIGAANIDNKGISGIEKAYDSLLKGSEGLMIMERDAKGRLRPTADLPIIPPTNGNSLVLTLDIELQRIVEYELEKGVERTKAESGTVIAIKPSTGEILAMASYPTYNPNNLSKRKPGAMKNKAITDVYEPGSTFKLITAASAIEEGLITPETLVNGHNGVLDIAGSNKKIRDDHSIGIVTFKRAFEKSSNVVFAQVGDSIPKNVFYKYIRDFGFGNTLGIDLIGEVKGYVPKPKKFNSTTRKYLSHGYGVSVSALQLVNAYATIANDGVMMRPFVVKTILDSKGKILHETHNQKIRKVVSERTARKLKAMLCGVVENGTGENAMIRGIKIAGKTGTTQQRYKGRYSHQHHLGSFAGFFPADNPKIVIIVIIDQPKVANYYGGSTAAPVFHNIALKWISINSDFATEEELPEQDTVCVPYLKGFYSYDAMQIARDFGLDPILYNLQDGIISNQIPKPGSYVLRGEKVNLYAKKLKDKSFNKTKRIGDFFKPDVRNIPIRFAIAIMNHYKYKVRVQGYGIVKKQLWKLQKDGHYICMLQCKPLK